MYQLRAAAPPNFTKFQVNVGNLPGNDLGTIPLLIISFQNKEYGTVQCLTYQEPQRNRRTPPYRHLKDECEAGT
jgi:hypothetical protein